jgi:hypothetical protein
MQPTARWLEGAAADAWTEWAELVRYEGKKMNEMMSACGVMCSQCPAYQATSMGIGHQRTTAEAWHRIYGLDEAPENISCGGCLGSDADLFHTSRSCAARRCCQGHGLNSCAECPDESCDDLEKAQAVWDEVPQIGAGLARGDFDMYARPYCDHRERLAALRAANGADNSTDGPG